MGIFFALPFVAFYCGLTNELSIAKLYVLRSLQPAFLGYGWILRKAILKSKVFVVVLINGGLGRMGLLACLKYNFGFLKSKLMLISVCLLARCVLSL